MYAKTIFLCLRKIEVASAFRLIAAQNLLFFSPFSIQSMHNKAQRSLKQKETYTCSQRDEVLPLLFSLSLHVSCERGRGVGLLCSLVSTSGVFD